MFKIAAYLTKNLILASPVAMILGFAYGLLLDPSHLKILIMPLTFLMAYPMMINLKFGKLLEGGDTKLQLLTHGLNFLVIPLIGLALGELFFKEQPFMILGLFIVSLLPTSGLTISYTGIAKGNTESAVKMTVIGLIVGSLLAPFYLQFFLSATININLMDIMIKIALVVFLPMVAGYITQRFLISRHGKEAFFKQVGTKYGPLSSYGVLGVVLVGVAVSARMIIADPYQLPLILISLFIFYAANYCISIFVGKIFLSRDDAIALVFGTVLRNMTIAMALVINAFGKDASAAILIVSIAWIIQAQTAAWIVKFADNIYGAKQNIPNQ